MRCVRIPSGIPGGVPANRIPAGGQPMTLLQNEIEAIHRAKKATNAIRDDVAYAEVESAIEDLIKVVGRVQDRLIKSNDLANRLQLERDRLQRELNESTAHRNRLIESSMAAWARIDDQEASQ
jgi:hypothetical protein